MLLWLRWFVFPSFVCSEGQSALLLSEPVRLFGFELVLEAGVEAVVVVVFCGFRSTEYEYVRCLPSEVVECRTGKNIGEGKSSRPNQRRDYLSIPGDNRASPMDSAAISAKFQNVAWRIGSH